MCKRWFPCSIHWRLQIVWEAHTHSSAPRRSLDTAFGCKSKFRDVTVAKSWYKFVNVENLWFSLSLYSSYSWWEAGRCDFLCNTKELKPSQSLKLNQMKLNSSYTSNMSLLFSAFCSLCLFYILLLPSTSLGAVCSSFTKMIYQYHGVNLLPHLHQSHGFQRKGTFSPISPHLPENTSG